MSARGLSFRSILATVTSVVIALALVVSGALVALTTLLHRTTSGAAASVESVRLAQEAEIDLLLHSRATDRLVRRGFEDSLRRRLSDARRFVTSERVERVIAETESLVTAYIAGAREPGTHPADLEARQDAAYAGLGALVTLNVAHSREANAAARSWDQRARRTSLPSTVRGS